MLSLRSYLAPLCIVATVLAGQSICSATELLHELNKLKTVGSVLYVAAHPDDENTALLTYLAQERNLDTAYLSLTRGGGGQNLIGPELKEGLGLIRANELLQARKIDGARQLFTRARDFGYSKNPEDTLENWQQDKILGDVVYAIRYFQPDVIITRFNPAGGRTHGHHTMSAQLALSAFTLAADPDQFSDQLDRVGVHQAKRIFWNGYFRGRGGSDEAGKMVELDIGLYNPLLGTSYTEIAAKSRSMHKSQGFGSAGRRGGQTERLILLAGEAAIGDFLDDVDTSWNRYEGGADVDAALADAVDNFEPTEPWLAVPKLLEVDQMLDSIPVTRLTRLKREALHRVILEAMGMFVEARSRDLDLSPGDEVNLQLELTNRSPVKATLKSATVRLFDSDAWPSEMQVEALENLDKNLETNDPEIVRLSFRLPETAPLTQPYWLRSEPSPGMYHLENPRLAELDEIPPSITVGTTIEIGGRMISVDAPAMQVISDPVKGEVQKVVAIRPRVDVSVEAPVLVFENGQPKTQRVNLTTRSGAVSGKLVAEAPDGWQVQIADPAFSLSEITPTATIDVAVTPPNETSEGLLRFEAIDTQGNTYDLGTRLIDYEHIGRQLILDQARTKLVRLELERSGNRIACIEGVGDTVPDALELIGYEVDRIQVADIERDRLDRYDTVIIGPRAFDALVGLDKRFDILSDYVEAGGTLVCQYNTVNRRSKSQFSSPYPIQLSRNRVSEEKARMRILDPDHPVFNVPNQITDKDFDNWVQERGLYYASSWDDKYAALLSANDRGETPKDGGLLVVQHGKGWYVYTGLAFFRQLPEGNAGAIRLFVNLISLGHEH